MPLLRLCLCTTAAHFCADVNSPNKPLRVGDTSPPLTCRSTVYNNSHKSQSRLTCPGVHHFLLPFGFTQTCTSDWSCLCVQPHSSCHCVFSNEGNTINIFSTIEKYEEKILNMFRKLMCQPELNLFLGKVHR